jgi:hypothetical protein
MATKSTSQAVSNKNQTPNNKKDLPVASLAAAEKTDPVAETKIMPPSVENEVIGKGSGLDAVTTEEQKKVNVAVARAVQTENIKKDFVDVELVIDVQDNEKHLFHVSLEKPFFEPNTGKRLSKAYIQKFTGVEFKLFKNTNSSQGFTFKVLHSPS